MLPHLLLWAALPAFLVTQHRGVALRPTCAAVPVQCSALGRGGLPIACADEGEAAAAGSSHEVSPVAVEASGLLDALDCWLREQTARAPPLELLETRQLARDPQDCVWNFWRPASSLATHGLRVCFVSCLPALADCDCAAKGASEGPAPRPAR